MIEGDDNSHRFLPRIRQELDKLPLTQAEKDELAPRLREYTTFFDTDNGHVPPGRLRLDSALFDFASKANAWAVPALVLSGSPFHAERAASTSCRATAPKLAARSGRSSPARLKLGHCKIRLP